MSALNSVTTALRDIPEALQLFLDLRLAVAFLDRRDLLFENVRDEFVDRRVAGEIRTALCLRHERFVEFDHWSKHGLRVLCFPLCPCRITSENLRFRTPPESPRRATAGSAPAAGAPGCSGEFPALRPDPCNDRRSTDCGCRR